MVKLTNGQELADTDYVEQVTNALHDKLLHILAASPSIPRPGTTEWCADPPQQVVDRLLATWTKQVKRPNKMADLVGPFYDTTGMVSLLGVSRQTITERAKRGTLLGVRTEDGSWIYPTFQFDDQVRLRSDLAPVLRQVRDVPRWSAAVWLRTANRDLNGASPEAWLADGGDPEIVQWLARDLAHRLAA